MFEAWLGEQVALDEGHAQVPQGRHFADGFDAFAERHDVEFFEHPQRVLDDGAPDRIGVDPSDHVHIQLDDIGLEMTEEAEAGVA